MSPSSNSAPKAADLSKPISTYTWQQSQDKEPLTFVKMLARAAGGTWVALSPHPLEEVKWTATQRGYQTVKVSEALEAVQKAGNPIWWESRPGYMVVYAGPKVDLDRMKERAPQEIVGALIASDSASGMVRAVEDLWKIKIDADPSLLRQREALLQARKPAEDEESDQENAVRYAAMMGSAPGPGMLEMKIAERATPEVLLEKLAAYFGGESQDLGGGRWRFTRISKPERVQEEIQKLQKTVEERTASAAAGFTSYAQRTGSSEPGVEEVEQDVDTPIPPLDDEAQESLDRLAMMGPAALETIRDFLKPENPSLARSALMALGAIKTPEATSAIVNFARDLPTRTTGQARPARRPLAGELIRVMKRDPRGEFAAVLADFARSEVYSPETRLQARMALAATGNTSLLANAKGPSDAPSGEMAFHLVVPPEPVTPKGADRAATDKSDRSDKSDKSDTTASKLAPGQKQDIPPDAVKAIATYAAPGGDGRAAFLSGRLGDADDIWLARQSSGQWTDFVFTGRQFERGQGGRGYLGNGYAPQKGSCKLKVDGDSVTISPPEPALANEYQRVQKEMNSPTLTVEARNRLNKRYTELYQKVSNNLKAPIVLSLAALRKDTDGDGLSDLVEERLGTDSSRADTDGDRVPDGKDRVPRSAPVTAVKDRHTLIDKVFTALFAGDPSAEPIVVVLERDQCQDFSGPSARVILLTKDEYAQRAKHLAMLRTLQFGGPKDAGATILTKDGPCLFNDGRTRAEVHFWVMRNGQTSAYEYRYGGGGQAKDYIARFERSGDWKLVNIKPWRYETAATAAQDLAQRMSSESYGY